jgi:hypothetical protein
MDAQSNEDLKTSIRVFPSPEVWLAREMATFPIKKPGRKRRESRRYRLSPVGGICGEVQDGG